MGRKLRFYFCEVCGIKMLNGNKPLKYCIPHRKIMIEYRRMIRFLDSESYKKLPEIKYKIPVLKKVMAN